MYVVSPDEIDAGLAFPSLIDAMSEAFTGNVITPVRHHHHVERHEADSDTSGTLLLMPAWSGPNEAESFIGVKVANIFTGNTAKQLPSVIGSYILMEGTTGKPLAILDANRLTVWRTAAASALAARFLATPHSRRLTMIGAGALAPFLIRAHMSIRPIEHVTLWNHKPDKAVELASILQQQGLPVTAESDCERAVAEADIVSCATLARQAVIKGAWLKPGTHLDLVGAFTRQMREADDNALQRGSVFVDTEAALSEGGDVALALTSGALGRADIIGTLTDLCRGMPGRRSDDEITVFKSVGAALEDLAAAIAVFHTLKRS